MGFGLLPGVGESPRTDLTRPAAALAAAFALLAAPAFAQTSVLTQHNDNTRSGANSTEVVLTTANVSGGNFGLLYTLTLDTSVNGQVLYVPHLTINNAVHNVVIAYTSNNSNGSPCSLWAFDADTGGSSLWHHTFTNSAEWTTCTPAIDPATNTAYVLTKDNNDSGTTRLRAINLLTGAEKPGSPITVAASVSGTGDGNNNGVVTFDTSQQNCRPGLLFANNSVYIGFAHNSDSFPYHGWLFRYTYNGSSFTQTNLFCTDPNGGLGGIWMAGNGIVADGSGDIYTTTGNGTFDVNTGGTSYGMSVLKLSPTLGVLDYFTPNDEAGNSDGDLDFGNCGVMFVPGTDRLFTGGTKFGSAFLLDSTALGEYTAGGPDNVLNRIDSVSSDNNVGQNPVGWDSGGFKYTYLWPSGSELEQFQYDPNNGDLNPNGIHQTTSGHTDGGSLAVSSNGVTQGILWAVGNNNVVYAINPTNLTQTPYWESDTNSGRDGLDSTGHFQFPTVANGRVYVPDGGNAIYVYGLLTTTATPAITPASGTFSTSQTVKITDSTSGSIIYYTTDGSAPYPGQGTTTTYSGQFSVSTSVTVKAIALSPNAEPSAVSSQTYTQQADAATHFTVTCPTTATAGTPFNVTVTALDAADEVATTYTGTVHFSTNAPRATMPANTTLTNGTGTFSATLTDAGTVSAEFRITAADTVTPSIQGSSAVIAVSPGPTTLFVVNSPTVVHGNVPFNVTVTARDNYFNTTTGYTGTVHFTSTDGSAVLPSNSTLTSGFGTFSVTLKTEGDHTVTATDTVHSSITGTSVSIYDLTAQHFVVTTPSTATAGTPFSFTVSAVDRYNNVAPGYAGTVHFSTNAPRATMPANSTLTNGTGTFNATLTDAGSAFRISAVDTVTTSIQGSSAAMTVSPGPTTLFVVNSPTVVHGNVAFNVTVTARDNYFNTTTAYTGTVHFTSTDGSAVLPSNSTLTSGFGTFSVTLKTEGDHTVTATDTVHSSITGTSVSIYDLTAQHFVVTTPSTATAGTPFSFTVTAIDRYNNVAPGYAGTVHMSTNAPRATMPANSTLTNGTGTFNATLTDAGTLSAEFKITASDTVTSSILGASAAIAVSPGPTTLFVVHAPSGAQPNVAFDITVTARDNYFNTTTAYTGTVHFTSTDGAAALPGNSTLTAGFGTFSVTLKTDGSQTVTATDTVSTGITGTSSSISVTP